MTTFSDVRHQLHGAEEKLLAELRSARRNARQAHDLAEDAAETAHIVIADAGGDLLDFRRHRALQTNRSQFVDDAERRC